MSTTAPEPVSIDEAKLNLRIDGDDEDDRIASLIVAARQSIERPTGLVLTPRAITETAPRLGDWISLNSWPISSVDEIRYPLRNVMTPLVAGAWAVSLKRRPIRIIPADFNWGLGGYDCGGGNGHWAPQDHHRRLTLPIEIDITAGYETPDDVPEVIKQAMHLMIAHLYTNRSAVEAGVRAAAVAIPLGVADLLDSDELAYV